MSLSKRAFLSVAAALLLGAALPIPGSAVAQQAGANAISADQKKAFEGIVREYILENP